MQVGQEALWIGTSSFKEQLIEKIMKQVDEYKHVENLHGSYLYNKKSAEAREELKQFLFKNC